MEPQEILLLKLPHDSALHDFGGDNFICDGSEEIVRIRPGKQYITARMIGIKKDGKTVFFEFFLDEPLNSLQERVDNFYKDGINGR